MSTDAGDALVRALHDHNPWWDDGANAFALPARPKSDFYRKYKAKTHGFSRGMKPTTGNQTTPR
ncbi:MAG: hypothetical protein A07HR60_02490 [uncultured archaeon A07HR60]|jgi:hypothetical protein|nr:MAG: hypothetical protein A07HR60_02490 [uncultured archaeon A07HR60]